MTGCKKKECLITLLKDLYNLIKKKQKSNGI
jgi:hypothetical protein